MNYAAYLIKKAVDETDLLFQALSKSPTVRRGAPLPNAQMEHLPSLLDDFSAEGKLTPYVPPAARPTRPIRTALNRPIVANKTLVRPAARIV